MTVEGVIRTSTWGTGYGSTRHLINHDQHYAAPQFGPRSRCRGGVYRLDFFHAYPHQEETNMLTVALVMRKRTCKACLKLAQVTS